MDTITLITGATRGLGYETARAVGGGGGRVVLGGRDGRRAEHAAATLRGEGIDAEAVVLDVTDDASVADAAGRVAERHGRLDVLVNNAGILPEATDPGEQPIDVRLFRRTFETNLFGSAAVTQAFLPLLRRSDSARILNVSSTMGSLREQLDERSPYFSLVVPAYQGSKAALNGLTIALSKALADDGISVNSVCPGWVQTDLGGPESRAAAPTPAAEAARFVAGVALGPEGALSGRFLDREGPVAW